MRRRYAFVALAALSLLLSGAALLGAIRYYHVEQAAQQRQGAVFERRLCETLAEQAANEPPPGSAPVNPSRAWEQREHAILAQLGPDVGCGGRR